MTGSTRLIRLHAHDPRAPYAPRDFNSPREALAFHDVPGRENVAGTLVRSQENRMGRIFETRKATMFRRWDRMAKQFARIGKDIAIAVKAGGPLPENNPTLRRVIQNARAVYMPQDKVEAAI